MAKFLSDGIWSERMLQCTHVVAFENKRFFQNDNFEVTVEWLHREELAGFYISESVNEHITYRFSDENTAFQFKMRFV